MRVDYKLIYSKRRTIGLTVERDSQVVVRAPHGMSEDHIRQAVETKKLWLFEKTNHAQKYPDVPHQKEFVTGETLLYLGRNWRLEVLPGQEGVEFHSKFVIGPQSQDQAGELFRTWYKQRAEERLKTRVRHFSKTMGASYNQVQVSDLKYRWGSCTPSNNLNFNWRIIKAPTYVIDYLIVHELAHLLESNHTPRFWNIVAVQVPRYEQAKDWLREHGNLIEVDF